MNSFLNALKTYISTTSFLIITFLVGVLVLDNVYVNQVLAVLLPDNKAILVFDVIGLVLVYEVFLKYKYASTIKSNCISDSIVDLKHTLEKGRLISDINAAFTEFQSNDREFISGEYYVREIMTLHDLRVKLGVNSYTQNKIEYLVAKIKHV